MNNKAMYNLSYGLFVLTARENEKDNGCIVNTVAQVTTSPNRILVAVNKNNYTHGMILRTGEFNVSILTERAAFDTFKHWGFQSGSDVDKAVGKCNVCHKRFSFMNTIVLLLQRFEIGCRMFADRANEIFR